MRALLSIVAIAALAAAAPEKPDPRCNSLDTACTDIFQAIQCGTVSQCISQWEKLTPPRLGNDTELCATCKKMVQEAKDQLMSNMTQEELREVLEGSCDDLIPIAPFNGMCKKLMDTFQDELNDMLVSRMDPTQVCTVSGLCWKPDNSDIEHRASELFLRKSAEKTCTTCKSNVNKIVEITKFADKRDIVVAFSKACQNAGFTKSKCDEFAQTYVAKFLHHFHTVPSEKTCQFFGRCEGVSRPMALGPADTMECEFCEAMIHKVVVQFNNTSMKSQVKTVLENICKHTGSWAQECLDRVEKNFDKAYDELISLLDPVQVCTLAGICNNQQSLRTLPMAKLTPARPAAPGSTVMCTICQEVAGVVEKAISSNFTETQLTDALHLVCRILPINNANCRDFVDKNLPELVEMFEERFTVEHVCSQSFNFCPAVPAVKQAPKTVCDECQQIAGYIVNAINDNRSEENIKAVLEKTCEMLPMDVATCQQFIDTNIDKLYELLREEVTVDHICQTLGLCGTRVAPVAPKPKKNLQSCGICSMVVDYLIDELKDNSTDAEILDALDRVCNILPVDKVKCTNIINTYGGIVISMIQQDVAADVICSYIGLCGAPKPKPAPTSEGCTICQLVAGYLIDELRDNKTDAAIEAALEKVCKVVPVDATECKNTVDTYSAMIIEMIQNNLTPNEICDTIKLCSFSKPADVECTLCESVSNFLIDELKDNQTDAAILEALSKVCKVLPFDKVECANVVNTYGGMIISMIQENATAQEICTALGLCQAQKPVRRVKGASCDVCKQVANFLINELKDNSTDAAIIAALEKVCKVVPVDATQCKNTIDVYGNEIIQMIKNNVSADEICASIGYCSARKNQIADSA